MIIKYLKYLWNKYILGYQYFTSWDMGIEDKTCFITYKRDRKGNYTIETIKYK